MQQPFKTKISEFIQNNIPFLFIIDFKLMKPLVFTLEEAKRNGILYTIKGQGNTDFKVTEKDIKLETTAISKEIYSEAFTKAIANINFGNSFLLNLTFPSKIETSASLREIFHAAKAPYKLKYKNEFVVYSPECFIQIEDNYIYSYPMKGTIDASLPNAAETLLSDKKEIREHNTIVDLIRNDLSIVAKEVTVTKFRYLEKIKSGEKQILQTSSEIRGRLPENWQDNFAETMLKLLPAGSISGAPKDKTIAIINAIELDDRGYYTGIFGVYNNGKVDSGVSIRFIENKNNQLYYRSGGGITALSELEDEYKELIQKIYVPTF